MSFFDRFNDVQRENLDTYSELSKEKRKILNKLKTEFKPATTTTEAVEAARRSVFDFLDNNAQSPGEIIGMYDEISFPSTIEKKELYLRKEINKHYKNRDDEKSKAFSIYLSLEHVVLLLSNPDKDWKNFLGLQKLQVSLKAEEYFYSLLLLMCEVKRVFASTKIREKLSVDIERMFALWASLKLAYKEFQLNVNSYNETTSVSSKHFAINGIVEYLERRYQYNRQYRDELVVWCERDIALYDALFSEWESESLALLGKKDDFIPRLPAFDILWNIYQDEENEKRVAWLAEIGIKIGYLIYTLDDEVE